MHLFRSTNRYDYYSEPNIICPPNLSNEEIMLVVKLSAQSAIGNSSIPMQIPENENRIVLVDELHLYHCLLPY